MHGGRRGPRFRESGKSGSRTHVYMVHWELYFHKHFSVTINSFHKPRDFQSPAETRAVMATEEKQRLQRARACFSGRAAPERRIEMQQKSRLRELVMSVCPITGTEAGEGYQK